MLRPGKKASTCSRRARIAGEQFALHRGAVSSPAAAQRTASVSQNADPNLRPEEEGRRQVPQNLWEPEMIGPFVQQQIDPLHTEIAEVERLIGMQDDLTIAGLCKGIDTRETENKSLEMRGFLEGMKARRRQVGRTCLSADYYRDRRHSSR